MFLASEYDCNTRQGPCLRFLDHLPFSKAFHHELTQSFKSKLLRKTSIRCNKNFVKKVLLVPNLISCVEKHLMLFKPNLIFNETCMSISWIDNENFHEVSNKNKFMSK